VAAVAALLMAVATPAWAVEYDAGYKDCPSNEEMVVRTRTIGFSRVVIDATAGSDYDETYDLPDGDWSTVRHRPTGAIDGTWTASGTKLSQFWTWAYCD